MNDKESKTVTKEWEIIENGCKEGSNMDNGMDLIKEEKIRDVKKTEVGKGLRRDNKRPKPLNIGVRGGGRIKRNNE